MGEAVLFVRKGRTQGQHLPRGNAWASEWFMRPILGLGYGRRAIQRTDAFPLLDTCALG